jgi:hypothetical protein
VCRGIGGLGHLMQYLMLSESVPAFLILLIVLNTEKTSIDNIYHSKMILVVSKILKNRKHL